MVNFRWTGYNALIFLAAMQAIPRDYYEAAPIDGAGTHPPVLLDHGAAAASRRSSSSIITSTIGGLQIFDEPRMYDQYGLGGADRSGRRSPSTSTTSAGRRRTSVARPRVAWMLFLIIVVFGIINFLVTRRIVSKGRR